MASRKMRRAVTWLTAALISCALLAGCGGGGSSSTSSRSTSTPATSTANPPATSSTPSTGAGAAGTSATIQRAVEACKRTIHGETTLSARAKAKLEAVCGKAANGDAAAVRKAAQEVCAEVINGSAVPPGPARERAIAACKSSK
jgi:hypothetical protein